MKDKMGMYHSSVSCERISKSLHNCFGLNSSTSRPYEAEPAHPIKVSTATMQNDNATVADVAVAQPKRKISRKSLQSSKEACCCRGCGAEKDDFQYNICSRSSDSQVSPLCPPSSCSTSSVTQSRRNGARDRKWSGDTSLSSEQAAEQSVSTRLAMDNGVESKQTMVHVNGNGVSIKTVSNSSSKTSQKLKNSESTRDSKSFYSNLPTNKLSPDLDLPSADREVVSSKEVQNIETDGNTKKSKETSSKPPVDVNYFRGLVTSETERLNESIEPWSRVLLGGNSYCPTHVCDEIRTVIGQTRLVISERFTQFTKLMDRAEGHSSSTDQRPVLISDLQGFWDMIYFQVQDVDSKFESLSKMKENSWKVTTPSLNELSKASVQAHTKPKSAQKKQPAKKKPLSKEEDRKRREAARKRLAEARKLLTHRNQVEQDAKSTDKLSEPICSPANFVSDASSNHKDDETTQNIDVGDAKASRKRPDSIVDAISCAVAINQVNADTTSLSSMSSTSMVH